MEKENPAWQSVLIRIYFVSNRLYDYDYMVAAKVNLLRRREGNEGVIIAKNGAAVVKWFYCC